jgi:hypothetical protein
LPSPRVKSPRPVKIAELPAPVQPVQEAVEESAETPPFPVVYGNPKIPDEQFYIIGSPYRGRFVNGLYIATNPNEEQSVRAALSGHGPEKPDRWRGRDRKSPWTDKRSGFTAVSDTVKEDYEHYHER